MSDETNGFFSVPVARISDLVDKLHAIRSQHGDLPVIGSFDSGYVEGHVYLTVRWRDGTADSELDIEVDDHPRE